MEITVEMVERSMEKAPESYAQAKEALEASEGNGLDAPDLSGRRRGPSPGGGDPVVGPGGEGVPAHGGRTGGPGDTGAGKEKRSTGDPLGVVVGGAQGEKWRGRPPRELLSWLYRVLVDNELEVWRRDEPVTSCPC